jgi:hypothetical protein
LACEGSDRKRPERPSGGVISFQIQSNVVTVKIGARRARLLCNLPQPQRFELIAEGLPIILQSAQEFWEASKNLRTNPREAEVLKGFANEESAKGLILLDLVRCPNIANARIPILLKYFYDHLARLIYAKAQYWKPRTVEDIQGYADNERQSHYLEGYAGEYILPNSTIFERESILYADIISYEDNKPIWNIPRRNVYSTFQSKPEPIRVLEAVSSFGLFSIQGLKILAEVWHQVEFKDVQTHFDAKNLVEETLQRVSSAKICFDTASTELATILFETWQMPMYNLDLTMIDVSIESLENEREKLLYSETGY